MDIVVLGTGHSVAHNTQSIKGTDKKILAFHEAFPYCHSMYDIIPDYWTWLDPNAAVKGMKYLLASKDERLKKMKILVPSFVTDSFAHFRMYMGTTPLGRQPGGWDEYLNLLYAMENIQSIEATTMKYKKLVGQKPGLMFGTFEFDSESVVGTRFKWGLENKLTSAVLPVCAWFLNTKNIYILGFDFIGPRFFSEDDRHPWSDSTQKKIEAQIPLEAVRIWIKLVEQSGVKLFVSSKPEQVESFLHDELEYGEI